MNVPLNAMANEECDLSTSNVSKVPPRKRRGKRIPEIAVVGELYDDEVRDVFHALMEIPPGSEVTMYFDSAGGSVYAAMAVAGLIRLRELSITGIVLGECSSAALIVFAACSKRLVSPYSVFLFHRVNWKGDKMRSEEAAQWARHFQWLEENVDKYQARLFGVAEDAFSEWVNQGRFVVGPELVAMGIAELIEV